MENLFEKLLHTAANGFSCRGIVFRLYYYTTKNSNMKHVTKQNFFKTLVTLIALFIFQAVVYAQDSTGAGSATSETTTTTTTSSTWYTQPWIWIVGGVLLLLVIIAMMRGNSSTTTERTTVIRNTSDRES
jgi:hypothetical protein